MNDTKGCLLKLTLLQGAMIAIGFIVFLSIKQLYQQQVMVEGFRQDLRDSIRADIEGREYEPTVSRFNLSLFVLPLILVVGRNAASIFYRASKKRRQLKRDIESKAMLKKIDGELDVKFSLYLRSFSDEKKLKRKKSIWWYIFLEGDLFGLEWESIELKLSSIVRRSSPMIAIGARGQSLGSGKLQSTDAEWKDLAVRLMKNASLVFLIPSTTEGVLWEIGRLRKYGDKTVYIMPPSNYYASTTEKEIEKYWSEIGREASKLGLRFPEYSSSGALMSFNEDGSLRRMQEISADFGLISSSTILNALKSNDIT
jgi:hypothetical protein